MTSPTGVPPIQGDRARLRRIVEELQVQQTTQGAGPVKLEGLTAGVVLNVLIGKEPPIDVGVEVGERIEASHAD